MRIYGARMYNSTSSNSLNVISAYSRMQAGTSMPANANEGDLFYRTSDKKLFIRRGSEWLEVDWQRLVQASPEWIAGRLRIQNGQLQISPDGNSWHDCIPAVGSSVIELASVNNTNYSLLYWIAPGTTAIVRNANHLPLVYASVVSPAFYVVYVLGWQQDTPTLIGLRPSGVSIFDGALQNISAGGGNMGATNLVNLSVIPTHWARGNYNFWGNTTINISPQQRFFVTNLSQGHFGYHAHVNVAFGAAPSQSFWLGAWFTTSAQAIEVDTVAITRLA